MGSNFLPPTSVLILSAWILNILCPTLAANQGGPFSLNQLQRPDDYSSLHVSTIVAQDLVKYGAKIPHIIRQPAEPTSLVETGPMDRFIVAINVGASVLRLSIDTGSSDLWVFSDEIPWSQAEGHKIYKPSIFASFSDKQTWKIRYADGSFASGAVYHDVVGTKGIWTRQQAVEIATNISNDLAVDRGVDGILGLGFSSINNVRPKSEQTFFDNVKEQLKLPLFAVSLTQSTPGRIDFGFINESRYTGKLNYVDVDAPRGRWGFKASGYVFGESKIKNGPLEGVVDTGAALIFLPDFIVQGFYSQVDGARYIESISAWAAPCSAALPSFTTIINNNRATVPGDLIRLGQVGKGSAWCLCGIQSNMNIGVAVFGRVFLRSQYVVFDARGPRLGFAPHAVEQAVPVQRKGRKK